ncbi:hypothetical protein EP7_004859 [Isosphaeraceae bacterium EP7]
MVIARTEYRWFFACLALLASGLCPAGCGTTGQAERSGEEMRQELPTELAALLPADVAICHAESVDGEISYRLWVVRREKAELLTLPKSLRGVERHELPATVLTQMLTLKAPGLEHGTPVGKTCRFTHWDGTGCEYQAREVVTDRGWFATLERIGK